MGVFGFANTSERLLMHINCITSSINLGRAKYGVTFLKKEERFPIHVTGMVAKILIFGLTAAKKV